MKRCVCVCGYIVMSTDRAAWNDNIDIGDITALKQLLDKNGFNSDRLLEEANTKPIKDTLFTNNERYIITMH